MEKSLPLNDEKDNNTITNDEASEGKKRLLEVNKDSGEKDTKKKQDLNNKVDVVCVRLSDKKQLKQTLKYVKGQDLYVTYKSQHTTAKQSIGRFNLDTDK